MTSFPDSDAKFDLQYIGEIIQALDTARAAASRLLDDDLRESVCVPIDGVIRTLRDAKVRKLRQVQRTHPKT